MGETKSLGDLSGQVTPLKVTAFGALKLIALSSNAEVQELARFVFEELKRVAGERDAMRNVLAQCGETFRSYELMHLAKGTQEGDEKARRNREMAERCETALSSASKTEG